MQRAFTGIHVGHVDMQLAVLQRKASSGFIQRYGWIGDTANACQ